MIEAISLGVEAPVLPGKPLFEVRNLHAYYGKSHILRGVNFDVAQGDVVCLLGRNGSGRSTTLKTIMGLVTPSCGEVRLNGLNFAGEPVYKINRAGIGYVPEEREIFANLSVDENLQMGQQATRDGMSSWTIEHMFDYFPKLRERRDVSAGHLSGGEQQMLTICRSLLGNPRVLMIDEPTEGLAPRIVDVVSEAIRDIHHHGVAVLLVEQKLSIALDVSNRVYVMGHGHIVFEGTPEQLSADPGLLRDWLAV